MINQKNAILAQLDAPDVHIERQIVYRVWDPAHEVYAHAGNQGRDYWQHYHQAARVRDNYNRHRDSEWVADFYRDKFCEVHKGWRVMLTHKEVVTSK